MIDREKFRNKLIDLKNEYVFDFSKARRTQNRFTISIRKWSNHNGALKTAFKSPMNYKPNALCRFNHDIRRMQVEFKGLQIIEDTDCD